jgi:hypothetical protein
MFSVFLVCLVGAACLLPQFVEKSRVLIYSLMQIFSNPVSSPPTRPVLSLTLSSQTFWIYILPCFERSFVSVLNGKMTFFCSCDRASWHVIVHLDMWSCLVTCDRTSWHVTVHRDMRTCIVTNFLIIKSTRCTNSPRKYSYFDVVVGLVWSHDPKSYAGGSLCYW